MGGPIHWGGRDALFGVPLFIAPGHALEQLQHAARKLGEDPLSSWRVHAQRERQRSNGEGAVEPVAFFFTFDGPSMEPPSEDGIAVVRVVGSLYRGMWWDDYSRLRDRVTDALADPAVRGVLLDVDSPGGRVAGLFDLTSWLHEVRSQTAKPIWACANDQATSAAYAIASACERVFATPTSIVGSIGAVMCHADWSRYDRELGVTYTEIASGDRKTDMSPHKPLTPDGRKMMQQVVDAAADEFFAEVSRYRGISVEDLRDMQAAMFVSADAVEARLVDEVARFDDVREKMRGALSASQPGGLPMQPHPFPTAGSPAGGSEDMATPTTPEAQAPNAPQQPTPAPAAAAPTAQPTPPAPAAAPPVDPVAAMREQAQLLANACRLAGRPELAGDMIAQGVTLAQCQTRLLELRAADDGQPVNGTPPSQQQQQRAAHIDPVAVHARWSDPDALSKHASLFRANGSQR